MRSPSCGRRSVMSPPRRCSPRRTTRGWHSLLRMTALGRGYGRSRDRGVACTPGGRCAPEHRNRSGRVCRRSIARGVRLDAAGAKRDRVSRSRSSDGDHSGCHRGDRCCGRDRRRLRGVCATPNVTSSQVGSCRNSVEFRFSLECPALLRAAILLRFARVRACLSLGAVQQPPHVLGRLAELAALAVNGQRRKRSSRNCSDGAC